MQQQILQELKELKAAFGKLIGAAESTDPFSIETLTKAASAFKKLSIERGEWIAESDFNKYIKGACYQAGVFIRTEFKFSNYFKRGHTYYYNKVDIIKLGKELADRKIDLGRYMELKQDQEKFKKYVAQAKKNKVWNQERKVYLVPNNLKDVTKGEMKAPDLSDVQQDLARLKAEFFEFKLEEYIDIYHGNYAMTKFIYIYEKYIKKEVKSRCVKWCKEFNYANDAIQGLTNKKAKFLPVEEDKMYKL